MLQNHHLNHGCTHNSTKQNESSSKSKNAKSRPSLEIGFFSGTSKEWITIPDQSSRDFTTPERGLSRYISKDLLNTISSQDVMLKLPEAYFLHHFIYNCRTSSFISSNDSRRSKSTLKKSDNKEMRTISSCECAVNSQNDTESNNSKSQTEIILKIPKRYQEDSMVDIKLIGTALGLQSSSMSEECECPELSFDSNKPLGSKQIESNQKKVQKYAIVADGDDQDSCLCPEEERLGKSGESGTTKTDTNKVSIKLGDNLFLSLVTDMDEQTEDNGCEECNIRTEGKGSDKFPAIKILVMCNGETIQEISSPRLNENNKKDAEAADDKAYNQIFYVNTCNKQAMESKTENCTSNTCENKNKMESMECCQKCCVKMEPEPAPQKKGTAQPKKNNQKQSADKKSSKASPKKGSKQPQEKSKGKQSVDKNKNQSATSLKNSNAKKCVCTAQPKQKSSLCVCPPNKDDIASLGSFSLFFIINDMDTGDCGCKKSGSGEMLQTAMICVHVDNSQDEDNKLRGSRMKQPCTTSSCPAIAASSRPQGNMTDKYGPPICSCPSSTASKVSSCSCPSVMGQSIGSSPQAKLPSCYICPFSKDERRSKELTPPRNPVHQSTNTSMRSSIHKNPCCQPSQIRFSVSVQAEKGKSCAAMVCPEQTTATTQCQSCNALKYKLEQTSVQVSPSNRSASIQPSKTCTPAPQGVQASISQKSAGVQPSTCNTPTCSFIGQTQARQVLSNICPPSCKINLPKPCPTPCPSAKIPQNMTAKQATTCDMKTGPSFTCTAVKSLSCPSLKQVVCCGPDSKPPSCTPSVVCVNDSLATQSKSCSICINISRLNDSRDPSLKKVCSFSGECKQDSKTTMSTSSSSMKKGRSKTSCSICKELAKLRVCDEEGKPPSAPNKGKPRVIPASSKLGRTKNFNQLSHLDVSGADNFVFKESMKGDLLLITEDYSDLKQAFEKFMVAENAKNPKCKYIKKG